MRILKNRRSLSSLRMKQQGFTLLELVIALGLIATIAGMSILSFDGSQGQGVNLYSKLKQYGESMKRMKFDTQCYPINTGALFNRSLASDSHCGIDLQQNWRGPYAQTTQLSGSDIALLEFSDAATLVLPEPGNNINGSGNRTQWAIIATDIPADVIRVVMEECNNGYESADQTAFKAGQCFITSGSDVSGANYDASGLGTGVASVGYIFDERY